MTTAPPPPPKRTVRYRPAIESDSNCLRDQTATHEHPRRAGALRTPTRLPASTAAAKRARAPHEPAGAPAAANDDVGAAPHRPLRSKRLRRRSILWDLLLGVVVVGAVVLGVGAYYFERYSIASDSMAPTLTTGDNVWALRLTEPPDRGDIVSFTHQESGLVLIKRVIGLPGEAISAEDGHVLINNGRLNELVWIADPEPTRDFGVVQLGEDEYFLMGDNRDGSTDSRSFGPISRGDIEYRILGR